MTAPTVRLPKDLPLYAFTTAQIRRLPPAHRRMLDEIAYNMRQAGYSYMQIATVIGWQAPLTAASAIERHRRHLQRRKEQS